MFYNRSAYDYHFIIKELAKESEGQFECLSKNIEKYITFSVPITKEHNNNKTIKYKIKYIGSFRFLSSSLSNDVDDLFKELHIAKCTDCKSYLELISIEDNKLIFKCLKCNNNHNKDFNKDIIKRLMNFVMRTLINLFCY